MLMVIFGAGASYDSVPSRPPASYSRRNNDEPDLRFRPPLANELFDDEMISIGNISQFSQCLPIVPYLQRRDGKSVEVILEHLRSPGRNASISSEVIEAAPHIRLAKHFFFEQPGSRWRGVKQPFSEHDGMILFPALAIPVETKKSFECPESHLDFLRDVIPKVKRLLIVGWRGAEAHFGEMLKENLHDGVRVMVVAGPGRNGTDVIDRLRNAGVPGSCVATEGGFTDFVVNREIYAFLKE
jgi:hypothetical protein